MGVNLHDVIMDGAKRIQTRCREVEEECGLVVSQTDLEYMGIIDFEFEGDPVHLEVHVFLARKFQGKGGVTLC